MTGLRTRVLLSNLTVVVLVLAVVGIAVLGGLESFLLSGIEQNLINQSRVASVVSTQTLLTGGASASAPDLVAAQGARLALAISQVTGLRTQVYSLTGRLVGDSNTTSSAPAQRPELETAGNGQRGYAITPGGGGRLLAFAGPLEVAGQRAGLVAFILPLTDLDAVLSRARIIFGSTAAAALLISILVSLTLSRAVTLPLVRLRDAARKVAKGQYSQRLPVRGRDEIADLAASFNHMATEVGQAVSRLAGEQNKLSAVLSTLSDGVIATDRSGSIRLANHAAERLMEELNGELLQALAEFVREAALRPEGLVREVRVAERVFWLQGAALKTPELTGAVVALRDVTELRRLEQQSRQFVSNVSHELRTPLTAIRGFAELLAEDPEPAARAKALRHLQGETERLYRLVSDVLELTSLESLPVRARTIDLVPLLRQVVDQTEPRARRYGQTLVIEAPERLEVLGDPDRLKQVVLNLLDNALKYSPPAARVTVSAAAMNDERLASVSVRDTGPGIAPVHQAHIFERFYRADKARSRSLGGSGLGLAIVQEIVEKHGGTVELDSEPGRGTEVRFTLPLSGPVDAAPANRGGASEPANGGGAAGADEDDEKV